MLDDFNIFDGENDEYENCLGDYFSCNGGESKMEEEFDNYI